MSHDAEVDALGLKCPLPVLKARKALLRLEPGCLLRVLADDPMAEIDMPHFCAASGHHFEGSEDAGDAARVYFIRRGG